MRARIPGALVVAGTALALAACGLNVQSPDLFQLTRTGGRGKLTLLVNDSGTIACNGASPQSLPDPLLLQARDLATSLDADAKARLNLPQAPDSVFRYIVKLQDGTVAFPDTAASRHKEFAQVELFVLQATQNPCKLSDS